MTVHNEALLSISAQAGRPHHGAAGGGCPVHVGGDDLVDPFLYSNGEAYDVWAKLRGLDGLSWRQVDAERGFWSIVKFEDADRVLRDTATFTSERGTLLDLLGTDDPAGGKQLAVTDPPRHTVMQTHLKKALAINAVEQKKELIRSLVLEQIQPLADGGVFDFATAMLMMPMAVTGTMMGLPRADWPWLSRLTTVCIAADDPEYQDPGGREATLHEAHRQLFAYFQDVLRHRRKHITEDLLSVLISTRFEGRLMSSGEIVANCYSLLLGANVTTPHSPNFLMAEFLGTGVVEDWSAHPQADVTGVEEALRWASPVNHFLRYAKHDVEIRGTRIAEGDATVVWLGAANRDDEQFADASTFDIRRKPNKHLAFGIGPHYCVGHSVARVTLRILIDELFTRHEDFQPAGKPERLISNFVSGYKHVPITARNRKAGSTRTSGN
jgi:cytochrome P450